LTRCYRAALDEVVQVQEKFDEFRASVGRADADASDRGPVVGPNRFVVGSSRHRMVARLAPNLHLMTATVPLRQFLDRSSDELLARSFLEVVHPDDAPALRRSLHEALKDGEGHNITFRVVLPLREADEAQSPFVPPVKTEPLTLPLTAGSLGSTTDASFRLSPSRLNTASLRERFLQMDVMTAFDDRGTPLHLRCHFLDITDRVLTERELLRITREVSEANARLRQTNEDLERLKESYRDLYHHAPGCVQ
jgi:hypothetical protein